MYSEKIPGPAPSAPQQVREREIPSELERLSDKLGILERAAGELLQRIEPARSQSPNAEQGEAPSRLYGSSMAESIGGLVERVEQVTNRLRRAEDELEL